MGFCKSPYFTKERGGCHIKKQFSIFSLAAFCVISFCGCSSVGNKTASLSVIYLAAAVISLFILIGYVFGIRKKNFWFIVLFSSVLVVNVGYYCLSISNGIDMALWANRISYLGSVFLPISMMMIILNVTKCRYKKYIPISLTVIGCVVFAIAASPGYLDIYYKEVSISVVNGVTVLEKVYGDWHIIYLFYLLGYFAAMISTVMYATVKKKVDSVGSAVMLNIAVFVNIGVWLIEQIVRIDFEFLSVSYIISELFLLGLNIILREQKKVSILPVQEPTPEVKQEDCISDEQISNFHRGLEQLTKTERNIFNLYLDGKTTKEILKLLNIKENTLKYHNKNIYGKFGVSTRKRLLEIAKAVEAEQK